MKEGKDTLAEADRQPPARLPGEEEPLLSQAELNITDKVRSNPFSWRGQFSPQLIEAHLRAYTEPSAVILDPFVGSGTVLVEAARRGSPAYGAEINPGAAIMARTYELSGFDQRARAEILHQTDAALSQLDGCEEPPHFSNRTPSGDKRRPLLRLVNQERLSSPLRCLLETLVITLDHHSGPVEAGRLQTAWMNLKKLVMGLPYTKAPVSVLLSDARRLPLKNKSVDFVITSPPYINVFNYHQQYRASVEALRWEVLPIARSEIGSNRKHRGNRFLTVIQYCLDMVQVLVELGRVCKPGARAIFVVGRESNVKKTAFYNGRILQRLATECLGLKLLLKQERVFQNRFGQHIFEDILHIEMMPRTGDDYQNIARHLAVRFLKGAEQRVPLDVIPDLYDAMKRVELIFPSPVLTGFAIKEL